MTGSFDPGSFGVTLAPSEGFKLLEDVYSL